MSSQYIYLLKEREFINSCENIYKIGKTSQSNDKRFKQHPKGSILIFQSTCSNCCKIEKIVINNFCLKFKQRTDIGTEYFEGECTYMILELLEIIKNDCNNTIYFFSNIKTTENEIKISEDLSNHVVNFLNNYYLFLTREEYDILPRLQKNKYVINRVELYNFWTLNSESIEIQLDKKHFYKILSENFTTFRTSFIQNGILAKKKNIENIV